MQGSPHLVDAPRVPTRPTPTGPARGALGRGDDSGVIAVVTAIVVAAVLVPVAALGLSSYVRTSVRQEMQRSAESGALAGAAGLVLVDLGSRPTAALSDPLVDLSTVLPPGLPDPLGPTGRACRATFTAYGRPVDDPGRDPADRSPVSATFATMPTCDAVYSRDPAFSSCVDDVFTKVGVLVEPVRSRLVTLAGSVTGPVAGDATDLATLALAVQKLVPALAHNGVQVELEYSVDGPLDGVLRSGPAGTSTGKAAARRLFKPVLPTLPSLAEALDVPVDTTALSTLTPVERVAVAQLQATVVALRVLVDGAERGTLDASGLTPYLDNTITAADALLSQTAAGLPLLGPLLGPVLAALDRFDEPVVLPAPVALDPACATAARELLDDLSYALTVNPDPSEQDLLPCVVEHVLGPTDLTTPLNEPQACVNRVFRAQLAPTT